MSKNSANLDVLRAIAVLMVFCYHIFLVTKTSHASAIFC
jgi:peptidoglycan/LPS O-acetylase OafA/YrhL